MRLAKIMVSSVGGTAGSGSRTYKLALPSAWVAKMGLAGGDGRVVLSFDGEAITLRPQQSLSQFRTARLARGHELLEIRYYAGDTLCTVICADQTAKELCAEDYTDNYIKTAFGKNPLPSWEDLEDFMEERCIPRQRAGLREYLEGLGLYEYDPLVLIQKTQGRMAEDDQWMEVERIR